MGRHIGFFDSIRIAACAKPSKTAKKHSKTTKSRSASKKHVKSPMAESSRVRDRSRDRLKSHVGSKKTPRPATVEDHKSESDSRTRSTEKGKAKETVAKELPPEKPNESKHSAPRTSRPSDPSGRKSQSAPSAPEHSGQPTTTGANTYFQVPEAPQATVAYPWFWQNYPKYPYQPGYHPFPESNLQPQPVSQNLMRSIPLGERPSASGYELLAETLAGNDYDQGVKPIYRRFDVLNHRVLLVLQDRLCEFEEYLCRNDAQDTQLRNYPGGVHPASRRSTDDPTSIELQLRQQELLATITRDLVTYYNVIKSFGEARELPKPTLGEVREYISYLSTQRPIVATETTFLNNPEDLILLGSAPRPPNATTVYPRAASSDSFIGQVLLSDDPLRGLLMAIVAATVGSVSTFRMITDFTARVTLVSAFLGFVLFTLLQSGGVGKLVESGKWPDGLCVILAYLTLMIFLAGAWK